MPGSADETDAAEYRSLLFSIAYGMTGAVGDANLRMVRCDGST